MTNNELVFVVEIIRMVQIDFFFTIKYIMLFKVQRKRDDFNCLENGLYMFNFCNCSADQRKPHVAH